MDTKKIIVFDLDDTLCFRPQGIEDLGIDKYHQCQPILEMINLCNKMYDKGHIIYIYTARGMKTLNGDVKRIYDELYPITLDCLKKFDKITLVEFHSYVPNRSMFEFVQFRVQYLNYQPRD